MVKLMKPLLACTLVVTAAAITYSCSKNSKASELDSDAAKNGKGLALGLEKKLDLENYSVTPSLVKKLPGFENLEVYSMISSDDEFPGFRFGGSADGAGLLKNPDDAGYTLLVNHEDNFSISRVSLDKNLKPIKGEYLLNSNGGQWRLCSGTLATPQEHGFGPLYLSCGESGVESMTHGIDPFAAASNAGTPRPLAALGRWSAENAVPLNKHAYPGKTVVLVGEDASDVSGGQLALYMSNSTGDLENGEEFMLKRIDGNQRETDMAQGQNHEVEFVRIPDHKTRTGTSIQSLVNPLQAIKFGRVEDIDYRKGTAANNREIYFLVTGQDYSGANADHSRTKAGRVYKLVLDPASPLKGTLTCVLDGDIAGGIASSFQNPDNITVTENFVYIKEDPNGYGTETHDAYVYQYSIANGQLKTVFELDHRRNAPDAAKYNVGGSSRKGSWEYGALIDISDVVHVPNTFLLAVQPHTWLDDKFKGVDGGTLRTQERQGSQMLIIRGLPK